MGMRANFARITTKGAVRCTSVQWSCYIDHNLATELESRKGNKEVALSKLFRDINKFAHISAIENISNSSGSTQGDTLGVASIISGGQLDPEWTKNRIKTAKQLKKMGKSPLEFITEYHFEDGLSAIYDEQFPNQITFGWEDFENGGAVFETYTIDELLAGKRVNGYLYR